MTTFLHTILLNIQIILQIVCQKQKNIHKTHDWRKPHTQHWVFYGRRHLFIHSWHRYCTKSPSAVTKYF